VDGIIGPQTQAALNRAGLTSPAGASAPLQNRVQQAQADGRAQTGGAGGGVPSGGGLSPGARDRENEIRMMAARERLQTQETGPRENLRQNTEIATRESDKAANARSLLDTTDRITRTLSERPDFANSLQSPAFTAFVQAQGGDVQKRLEEISNTVRINTPQDKTRFQELLNDLRRLELAGITQSGLSSSQLNTERESQRVVDAFATSLRNTPQAAIIQTQIAKANIQYQREFAKYLGSANQQLSPARIRSDFDDKIGDKIYRDLMPVLEALRQGRGVVDFRSRP
jgi:hypothetical protein